MRSRQALRKARRVKVLLLLVVTLLSTSILTTTGCESLPSHVRGKSRKESGWTPLHQAALKSDVDAAEAIVKSGSNLNPVAVGYPTDDWFPDEDRHVTPLYTAVDLDHTGVAKVLICAGADVTIGAWRGITPLQVAAKRGNMDLITLLVEHGASIRRRDDIGDTVLHGAKTEVIAKYLIQKGAQVDERNNSGVTPLHYATDAAIARLLLSQGASLNRQDAQGRTPLVAAAADSRFETAKVLVSAGADVNLGRGPCDDEPGDNYSALQWAVKNNDSDLAHRLLARGARVNVNGTEAPLLLAAGNGTYDSPNGNGDGISADRGPATVARLLLEYGGQIEAKNSEGRTPLFLAALEGDDVMASLLIRHGANVHSIDATGTTPLHWAALNDFPRVVKLLLEHGANPDVRSKKGETPRDWGRSNPEVMRQFKP